MKTTKTIPLIGSTKMDQGRITSLLDSMAAHECTDDIDNTASCWLCQGLLALSNNPQFAHMAGNLNAQIAKAFVAGGQDQYILMYVQALAFCFMLGTRYQQNLELEFMLNLEVADPQEPEPKPKRVRRKPKT